MGRLTYKELSKRKIKKQRNIVISTVSEKGSGIIGYSVSEQLVADEEGREIKLFLKNGLGILSEEGLLSLKEAVDEACNKLGLSPECKCENCNCECEADKK